MMMNTMVKQGGFGIGSVSPAHSGGGPMMMDRPPLTPMSLSHSQSQQQNSGQMIPLQPPGGTISLALLIDFIVQRTYHELTVLAELLPRKTDMERKQEIFNFSARTRLLAVRLLGLVKWASSAAKVDKSVHIMNFLEKQSLLFVETADNLSKIARETLVHARLPNFHIPAAVEVLTTGTYSRLPTCIRERIVPADPITAIEKKSTLTKLNQVIQNRLVITELPAQMRNLKVENGRVVFSVDNEFEVSLTVLGDSLNIPWRIIEISILVEDKEIGDGMSLVHPLQIHFVHQLAQARLDVSHAPLKELYNILHAFAQSLQLEVLYSQVLKLCRERLGDYLTIEEYTVGRSLILGYWKELSVLDPKAELGYRIIISVDSSDPSQPLGVQHQPPLLPEETSQTGEGLRSNQLEKILVHTVYLRSKIRLAELRKEIEMLLSIDCYLQGSPPVLSIPVLSPCLKSEQLLVAVNIHTGSYLVHVPQFDPSPPVVNDIQQVLNTAVPDIKKLNTLISQLRYWITEKRCEKTLQHLPASASEKITLLKWEENPILKSIGPHRLTIKFQRYPYAILIAEFKEKEDYPCEMDYFFYIIKVKKASAEENEDLPIGATAVGAVPKFYLKPITVIPLDTFAATHGPFTEVDVDASERILGKRKSESPPLDDGKVIDSVLKKSKYPEYYVPELAHIVAMCDERLPFALLISEFTSRGIVHTGCYVEANGSCLSVPILQFPLNLPNIPKVILEKLNQRQKASFIRTQTQLRGFRTWNMELKFSGWGGRGNVPSAHKPVFYSYEMGTSLDEHIPKVVDMFLDDWLCIVKLFCLVYNSKWCRRIEMSGLVSVKSYTWNKLILAYGPNRTAIVTVTYSVQEKCYKLIFGGNLSHNPHTLLRLELQHFINSDAGCLDGLMKLLNETYEPLYSLTKLPTMPQLGTLHSRPQIPVQTFVIVPQSPTHVRIVYLNIYCLDVHCQPEGLVSIRDGAYSLFDKSHVLGEFIPTQGLKAFLSKHVDENALFRRRSQSEDDNPPSPITTMDIDPSLGSSGGGPSSASPFLSAKPQSPAPGRSNPHTPASPHPHINSNPTGYSPATSFANLASPPSLSHLSQQSPNPSSSMLPHPSPSPSTLLPAPSPSGGPLSVPTPSPNPNHTNPGSQSIGGPGSASTTLASLGGAGHPSPFFHAADSSPAAVQSPWAAAGSPGMPRPSPARVGHSPGQMGINSTTSRVLPQRSWAGAIPTILTHDALDILCTPVTSVDNHGDNTNTPVASGHPCSPLERFLGCSYLRRQLQRIVQTEDQLTPLANAEPGVLLFRSETMQFRVGLDINHFQSLQLKITPAPENPTIWNSEEIQLLENFFVTRVVSPPFRTNGLAAFARMVSLPPRIIRDCIKIINLQLYPHLVEQQGWKWYVQLCLTVPPSAMPIIPQGMAAIVTSQSKILIYLHLTRVQTDSMDTSTPADSDPNIHNEPEKVPFVVIPLIHEITTNTTQLAERRAMGPPSAEYSAVSQQLKRFTEFHGQGMQDCSIYLSVQDLLARLILPPEVQPPPMPPVRPPGPGPMVRPMMNPGQSFPTPHNPIGPNHVIS